MRLTWDFWRVPCWAARFKKRPIVWTIWSRLTRWELCDLLRLCAETKRKTSTAYLMNDNKLPIVTLKVCCENVQKANKAHVSFIIEEFFFFFFFLFRVAGPVSPLNYLTRTPGSKALMRPVRPLCFMQIEVFLMKASWIIHERCSTRRNAPQEHIRGGKNCFGKIKIDVSSISPFRLISRAAHHLLINRRQQTEITHLISVQSAGGAPAPCPLRCSVCRRQLLVL